MTARGGCFRNGAELRRVHKAVRGAEIDLVQGVEEFCTELEPRPLQEPALARKREVERCEARADDRVAAEVAEGESRRSRKGFRIEPFRRGVRARSKEGLAGKIRADRVFGEHCARVCRVYPDARHR